MELSKLINRDGIVVIPDGITIVPAGAFEANKSLKAVSIHSDVTEIGESAFACCWNLEVVKMHATSSLNIQKNAFEDAHKLREISVPSGTADFYKDILPEGLHDKIIERRNRRLVIDKFLVRYPIIPAEIFEHEEEQLWKELIEQVGKMQEKQESLLPLMQDAKNNLPTEEDLLNSTAAQQAFVYYIQLRAVYALLHWIWDRLDRLCLDFAKLSNARKDATAIKEDILKILRISMNWSKYPNHKQEDLVELHEVCKKYYGVCFGVVGYYTLSDIVLPLLFDGFNKMPPVLQTAIQDAYPTDINIDKLLNITENINLIK